MHVAMKQKGGTDGRKKGWMEKRKDGTESRERYGEKKIGKGAARRKWTVQVMEEISEGGREGGKEQVTYEATDGGKEGEMKRKKGRGRE